MQELIDRVITATGLDASVAEKAIGIIMSLLRSQGDQNKISDLFEKLPGATELADQYGGDGASGGGLLGMLGGGAMGGPLAAVSKLQSAGLDMEQIKQLGKQTLDYAKENAGEELVRDIAGSIPGLSSHV